MKSSSINDVITAIVALTKAAVSYPVYDGPPSTRASRGVDRWLSVGASDVADQTNPTESARMTAQVYGLGQVARLESLDIECVAVGKSTTVAAARSIAMAVVEDVSQHLTRSLSSESFGAQVSSVTAVRSHNKSGGAIVEVQFTISASARLT